MPRVMNVLFICTANSARSIIAESLLNRLGYPRFVAYSAGSHPGLHPNPLALEILGEHGFETRGLRSKSWEEFALPHAPQMDFVFTVCDRAAGEACPMWPGQPITAHWGFADPAAVLAPETAQRAAFTQTVLQIKTRLEHFLALPVERLDRLSIQEQVIALGLLKAA